MNTGKSIEVFDDRRTHPRHGVELPVRMAGSTDPWTGCAENLSEGGMCLRGRSDLAVGQTVDIEVDLPGRRLSARLEAEVRWNRGGRVGLMFRGGAVAAVAAFVATLAGPATALAQTSVPEFDPNADTVLDMDAGSERPDEYTVLQAFEQQYDALDKCVSKAKKGRNVRFSGDADVEVLLNPGGNLPLGLNAALPHRHKKLEQLRQCIRSAVADAPFPAYDGPPVIVSFSFELDPGMQYVED